MTLRELKVGQSAKVLEIGGKGTLRQHFLDMGILPGAIVKLQKFAPMGDPMEVLVRGYVLSLRLAEAQEILIEPILESGADATPDAQSCPACDGLEGQEGLEGLDGLDGLEGCSRLGQRQINEINQDDFGYSLSLHEHNSHPGIGEAGKYHDPTHEDPLPQGTLITFALVGQQNCGKTTLFNQLTGSNQHVGNFPGVTVDRKDGQLICSSHSYGSGSGSGSGGDGSGVSSGAGASGVSGAGFYPHNHTRKRHWIENTRITDLPGIYSLTAYTQEEQVSRDFLLSEKPHCIINVVDATNIERHLYLTVQLMELGVPMVLAVNMMDELTGNGGSIRVNEMEKILGIPVVPISASKGEGINELVEHAMHVAIYREVPARNDFCSKEEFGGAVHRCMHSIMHLIEDHCERVGLPVRFAAGKLIEGEEGLMDKLQLTQNEQELIEHINVQMEEERGLDRAAAMADMRFGFISHLCQLTVVKPRISREYMRSKRIDRILTGRWTAIPIFVLVMCLVIWLSIDVIGAPLQDWLQSGIDALCALCVSAMERAHVTPAVTSLVGDAIFGGVGSVLSFMPIIIVLFFFLSLIEDSGYMARIAFVTDKLLRKLGLSGRSIVPLLIGFGCSVPAVMATRTLPSARDRKMTILLTPFMSCSAKIPIYGFFTATFFPGKGGLILAGLYVLAILIGILVALVVKLFHRNYTAAPFVMELPNYRMPGMKNVTHLLWDKTKDFVQRAFSVILVATILIWLLQSFDLRFNLVENSADSMMAGLAGLLEPLFRPIGLGDWRIVTSLISGFMAKESVVATMEVLGVTAILTVPMAVSMLLFCLLYSPCVAAISSIKRELGWGWALWVILFQCLIAWVAALIGFLLTQAVVA